MDDPNDLNHSLWDDRHSDELRLNAKKTHHVNHLRMDEKNLKMSGHYLVDQNLCVLMNGNLNHLMP